MVGRIFRKLWLSSVAHSSVACPPLPAADIFFLLSSQCHRERRHGNKSFYFRFRFSRHNCFLPTLSSSTSAFKLFTGDGRMGLIKKFLRRFFLRNSHWTKLRRLISTKNLFSFLLCLYLFSSLPPPLWSYIFLTSKTDQNNM
jgi:hypothetical protein